MKHPEEADERSPGRLMEQGAKRLPAHSTSTPAGREAERSGAPMEVIENLSEIEDEGEVYETIEDIWPDYPSKEDFLFNEDEY